VYWANAVPDADAAVDLTIGDTKVKFAGRGYHDKNWGDTPFVTTTDFWYWGHATVGPYSVVWFDAKDSAGKEHTAGYVAKDGALLEASCADGSVKVRPWGANAAYPPKTSTGVMQGVIVEFDVGRGQTFWANVTTTGVAIDVGVYVRTIGTAKGGFKGDKKIYDGVSLFEEFKFAQ
jgi:hypothetical protein